MTTKKRFVLASEHRRPRLPITGTIAWALLLDWFGAPGWAWGAFWTMAVLLWGAVLYDAITHETVERSPQWQRLPGDPE